MKWYYLLAVIILTILSCTKEEEVKDECIDEIFIGDYYLLQSSRDKFPYHEVDSLVFEDSLKKEIKFYVEQFSDSVITNIIPQKCDLNPEETIDNIFFTDRISYNFRNDSLDLTFYITMYSVRLDSVKVYDNLLLRMTDRDEITIIVDPRTSGKAASSYTKFQEILGKEFINVFRNINYDKTKALMFFNFPYGILGFRDRNGHTWVHKKTINKPIDPEKF